MDEHMEDYSEYEEQWQQVDEKVILAQLLAEQQRTNMLLEKVLSDGTDAAESAPTMYECQRCQTTVQADERQRHAEKAHKAPADMAESLFTETTK